MNGTNGIMPPLAQMPQWTTTNRPPVGTAGTVHYFGFNTTLNCVEYWSGTEWTVIGYSQLNQAYSSNVAGVWEYDGKAFANNPVASDRGIVPSVHFLRLSADQTGANSNTNQPWFPGGGSTSYNALASTTYFFEGVLFLVRSAGTTSHNTGVGFDGSATFTSFNAVASASNPTGNALTTPSEIRFDSASSVAVTAANTSATENIIVRFSGIMSVNGAGTIRPVFAYSVAPGGAPTVKANSYFRLFPVGTDTVLQVGSWA